MHPLPEKVDPEFNVQYDEAIHGDYLWEHLKIFHLIPDEQKAVGIEDAPILLYQSDDSLLFVRNEVGNFKMFPEIIPMDSLVILDIELRINLLWKWMHSLA